MRSRRAAIFLALIALTPSGCATYTAGWRIDAAAAALSEAAPSVNLGDRKGDVLARLEPSQSSLRPSERKPPDRFLAGGSEVEIHYFRSRRQADGITTDDEFTPYMFVDGQLVAIGWAALGGAGSTANPYTPSAAESRTDQSEPDRRVYDQSECVGPVVNGRCHGTILPNRAYHPTCHGEWINGQCTGPQF